MGIEVRPRLTNLPPNGSQEVKLTASIEKAHADAEHIFRRLLPAHGLTVRPAQITLCHEMLDALFMGRMALCDAGVGIGKTHAYLVAGLLWQKYKPRGYPRTLTVSTSRVALQNAIIREYLPQLSQMLVTDGLLAKPSRAMIRKGRERYVCDVRLAIRQAAVKGSRKVSGTRKTALFLLDKHIDMDEVEGLSDYDRAQVCVPADCPRDCIRQHVCRYREFLKKAKSEEVTIQICNHNFLIADAIHRQQESRPLLKDYHILIVDEAHKLPEAARQMYGKSLALSELDALCTVLEKECYQRIARRLHAASNTLMKSLRGDEETENQLFLPTPEHQMVMRAITAILHQAACPSSGLSRSTVYELERTEESLALFSGSDEKWTRCVHYDTAGNITLNAISNTTAAQLSRDLWRTGRPAILTSGTLSAGGSFARTRQQLGLERLARCKEFTVPSPFDYERNCLIYIPAEPPGKDASVLAGLLKNLLSATHGHALILFTSYTLMSEVCRKLKSRIPFPLIEAWRGSQQTVFQFKEMPNAVLCAAGPCWEGLDFPGDMVSLLAIVRLPFPTPTPVHEAERERYQSLREYIRAVVVPEMQTKLRQGVGRAIRTETDTCVIAILDGRAAPGGRYHEDVRRALPPCPLTNSIQDVERFIRTRKSPEYFHYEEETCT